MQAIVTGVSGQDGYYMAQLLVEKGYHVLGITHRNYKSESTEAWDRNIDLLEFDIGQYDELYDLVRKEKPDEIYNFAAQSSSIHSWDKTRETCELNFMAPVAILEAIRDFVPKCHFFQASSAEIFGDSPYDIPQVENTRCNPITPYATAKRAADCLIQNYRKQYGIYAVSGVFYNHESIRRKESFLSTKIVRTVARIKLGQEKCLCVGNINSRRDWGFAPDYMYAAWSVMQLEQPDDYIFATGILHSVREMIEIAFKAVGLPIHWEGSGIEEIGITNISNQIVVRVDTSLYRNYDRADSVGNPNKLFEAINWEPKITFEQMITNMTNYFIREEERNVQRDNGM